MYQCTGNVQLNVSFYSFKLFIFIKKILSSLQFLIFAFQISLSLFYLTLQMSIINIIILFLVSLLFISTFTHRQTHCTCKPTVLDILILRTECNVFGHLIAF